MKVRELAKLLTEGGWEYVGSTGSHHHYKHPKLPGKLTIPGNPNRDIKVGTLNRLLKLAVIEYASELRGITVIKRYGVVIEGDESGSGFSAYAPDLPGCIGAGATVEETARDMRSAITAHIQWLLRDGDPVPDPKDVVPVDIPHASVTFIEVDVPAPAKTLKA